MNAIIAKNNPPIDESKHPISLVSQEKAEELTQDERTNQCLHSERVDLKTIARIREIGLYTDGWDDANGKAASKQALDDAENFIRQLFPDVKEPIITLAVDGEINFLWILPDFRLDLGVYGDGSYSYYGRTSSGKEFIADENSLDEKLSEEILAFITNKTHH